MESLSRQKGAAPHFRMTAALSDGEKLYAVRYASDEHAPTLYHRWSDSRSGRAVVSEPLETGECWDAVPPGSFCTFDAGQVKIEPFAPRLLEQAA
jgi:glutamine amidotransferase